MIPVYTITKTQTVTGDDIITALWDTAQTLLDVRDMLGPEQEEALSEIARWYREKAPLLNFFLELCNGTGQVIEDIAQKMEEECEKKKKNI